MLRRIRITLAALFFVAATLLFLDFTGTAHLWLGWVAKAQFLPALLALNLAVVVVLNLLTLLFGRIYCSIICPLGVMQDMFGWLGKKAKKNRYTYSKALSWLRYGVLAVFVVCLVAGIGVVVRLLAPYSAYGRIASSLLQPLYMWGNNGLAAIAEHYDSYAFYSVDVWMKSLSVLVVAVVTVVVLAVLAWRNGRTYCNTICPVGTILGFISRCSLFRLAIDTNKCNGCGLCARNCKAACIDSKRHTVDYSRCVACMDCIGKCHQKAISYTYHQPALSDIATKQTDNDENAESLSRRKFLSFTALLAATSMVRAQEKKVDGGLAAIADKKVPERATRIVPPGAQSLRNMERHCTGCQLCVSVCPNQVLRPSGGLTTLMQPECSYERGYCRPECTKCSEVCPTGAILRIDRAEKSAIQIGHAVWMKENCLPFTDGVACGNCARHCPVGAIQMISPDYQENDMPAIPSVNTERCIGCGACENLCPARPFSAIYVEGHERHRIV